MKPESTHWGIKLPKALTDAWKDYCTHASAEETAGAVSALSMLRKQHQSEASARKKEAPPAEKPAAKA